MAKALNLGGIALPTDAVTQTIALLAVRRAGKSNAAVVLAEEMFKAGLPWVAIDPKGDWWGMRSSRDGKGAGLPIPIFGGLHGDMPLQPEAGHLIADMVTASNLTCILDVSEFPSKAGQLRFLADMFERLFRLHGSRPEPRHLFLEEADDYLPQRVMSREGNLARCVGAATKIVKQGGSRGLGCTIISQRSAVVNKDALTQVETMIALRTTSPQDRAAIKGWVDYHAVGSEIVESLPSLENGEAWVISPHWLGRVDRVRFRQRETFDSGSTPTMRKSRQVATMHEIDLGAIGDQMSSIVEESKANDPKLLRARIVELERELAKQKPAAPRVEYIEVPAPIPPEVEKLISVAGEMATSMVSAAGELHNAAETARGYVNGQGVRKPTPEMTVSASPRGFAPRSMTETISSPRRASTTTDVHLKAGARRILETLARHHPVRHSRAQVGTLTKFKTSGGTFSTYWALLKRAGYIEEADGLAWVTDEGLAAAGVDGMTPMTPDEVLQQWRGSLRAGARRMLDKVIARPGMSRGELAAAVEMEVTGGTFSTYLSTLKRNHLVTDFDGALYPSDLIAGATS